MWPEFIRLLFVHADERHEIDSEAFQDTTTQMGELLGKLGGQSPQSYTWSLTYREKMDVLLLLVDTIHDLDSFKQFLNKRLEDKSTLFKQKNDLHSEIKKLEQEKQEAVLKFNNINPKDRNEKI